MRLYLEQQNRTEFRLKFHFSEFGWNFRIDSQVYISLLQQQRCFIGEFWRAKSKRKRKQVAEV